MWKKNKNIKIIFFMQNDNLYDIFRNEGYYPLKDVPEKIQMSIATITKYLNDFPEIRRKFLPYGKIRKWVHLEDLKDFLLKKS